MKQILIAVALIFICGLAAAQRQGICGKVEFVEGNQMPGTNKKSSATPVKREIYIYKPVNRQSLKMNDGLYANVPGEPVRIVTSLPDGTFTAKLPVGDYSIFIKEAGGFFGNIFGRDGTVNPVSVKKREFTSFRITVNHKAVY